MRIVDKVGLFTVKNRGLLDNSLPHSKLSTGFTAFTTMEGVSAVITAEEVGLKLSSSRYGRRKYMHPIG